MSLYSILNVARSASNPEIKAAYRLLALSLHPDVNGGCDDKTATFKLATEAYETLSDEDDRRKYDSSMGISTMSTTGGGVKEREIIYAPSPAPGESVYNFQEWNNRHYGTETAPDTAPTRNSGVRIEAEHERLFQNANAKSKWSERDSVTRRMHERREQRRSKAAEKKDESSCIVQ
jgi:DnaJ-class molecular chaperone